MNCIENLPNEAIYSIMCFLNFDEILKLSETNKFFNNYCNDDYIWKKFCVKTIPGQETKEIFTMFKNRESKKFSSFYKPFYLWVVYSSKSDRYKDQLQTYYNLAFNFDISLKQIKHDKSEENTKKLKFAYASYISRLGYAKKLTFGVNVFQVMLRLSNVMEENFPLIDVERQSLYISRSQIYLFDDKLSSAFDEMNKSILINPSNDFIFDVYAKFLWRELKDYETAKKLYKSIKNYDSLHAIIYGFFQYNWKHEPSANVIELAEKIFKRHIQESPISYHAYVEFCVNALHHSQIQVQDDIMNNSKLYILLHQSLEHKNLQASKSYAETIIKCHIYNKDWKKAKEAFMILKEDNTSEIKLFMAEIFFEKLKSPKKSLFLFSKSIIEKFYCAESIIGMCVIYLYQGQNSYLGTLKEILDTKCINTSIRDKIKCLALIGIYTNKVDERYECIKKLKEYIITFNERSRDYPIFLDRALEIMKKENEYFYHTFNMLIMVYNNMVAQKSLDDNPILQKIYVKPFEKLPFEIPEDVKKAFDIK